jgi:alanyl-tRNA synthetase
VRIVDPAEAARLPLRKEIERSGPIRLVDVEGLDLSACGGTHVSRTGAIGSIAVIGWERFKGGTRLTFACGGRALASHRQLRDIVADAGRRLSVGPGDIGTQVDRLQQEARAHQRRIDELSGELLTLRAAEWRRQAETIGPLRCVIRHEASADVATLKAMAQAIVAGDAGLVAVLAADGNPTAVVAARSAGVTFDAGAFITSATGTLGGRGGGRPELAQAGVTADAERVFAHFRASFA